MFVLFCFVLFCFTLSSHAVTAYLVSYLQTTSLSPQHHPPQPLRLVHPKGLLLVHEGEPPGGRTGLPFGCHRDPSRSGVQAQQLGKEEGSVGRIWDGLHCLSCLGGVSAEDGGLAVEMLKGQVPLRARPFLFFSLSLVSGW